jgi:hypothetical protein
MSSHWPLYLLSVLIWVLTDHDIYCPYWYEFSLTMIFTLRIYMSSHWPWYLLSVFIWLTFVILCALLFWWKWICPVFEAFLELFVYINGDPLTKRRYGISLIGLTRHIDLSNDLMLKALARFVDTSGMVEYHNFNSFSLHLIIYINYNI